VFAATVECNACKNLTFPRVHLQRILVSFKRVGFYLRRWRVVVVVEWVGGMQCLLIATIVIAAIATHLCADDSKKINRKVAHQPLGLGVAALHWS
jgi:hypothetical protein